MYVGVDIESSLSIGTHIGFDSLGFEGICAMDLNIYEITKNAFCAFELHQNAIKFLMHYGVSFSYYFHSFCKIITKNLLRTV